MLKINLTKLKQELKINRPAWQIYLGFLAMSIILFQVNPQKYGFQSFILIIFGTLCYYFESRWEQMIKK